MSFSLFGERLFACPEKNPEDFMSQLSKEEFENLKSQIATSKSLYPVPKYRKVA